MPIQAVLFDLDGTLLDTAPDLLYALNEQIEDIYIMGLATDYCVKYSALDAAALGFNVYVIEDACRGVELKPGDIARAFEEMRAAGVKMIHSTDIFPVMKIKK